IVIRRVLFYGFYAVATACLVLVAFTHQNDLTIACFQAKTEFSGLVLVQFKCSSHFPLLVLLLVFLLQALFTTSAGTCHPVCRGFRDLLYKALSHRACCRYAGGATILT